MIRSVWKRPLSSIYMKNELSQSPSFQIISNRMFYFCRGKEIYIVEEGYFGKGGEGAGVGRLPPVNYFFECLSFFSSSPVLPCSSAPVNSVTVLSTRDRGTQLKLTPWSKPPPVVYLFRNVNNRVGSELFCKATLALPPWFLNRGSHADGRSSRMCVMDGVKPGEDLELFTKADKISQFRMLCSHWS